MTWCNSIIVRTSHDVQTVDPACSQIFITSYTWPPPTFPLVLVLNVEFLSDQSPWHVAVVIEGRPRYPSAQPIRTCVYPARTNRNKNRCRTPWNRTWMSVVCKEGVHESQQKARAPCRICPTTWTQSRLQISYDLELQTSPNMAISIEYLDQNVSLQLTHCSMRLVGLPRKVTTKCSENTLQKSYVT